MKNPTTFVGLDVHAATIAVAVAEGDAVVRSVGTIANTAEAVRRLVGRLGPRSALKVCYEAGPTGYVLYWQLTKMGIHCEVIAPSLIPKKPGDRIKTDRRDAEHLATSYRAGSLTSVWVPDSGHEALRDLIRAREAAKEDETRAKHRLTKYLLRYGERPSKPCASWSAVWWQWARSLTLAEPNQNTVLVDHIMEVDQQAQRIARLDAAIDKAIPHAPEKLQAVVAALQSLRGVAKLSAVILAVELGTLHRFTHAAEVMSYTGLVPSEHSSGPKNRRGTITKTGNSHVRRVLVESAWHYRHRPKLNKRQKDLQPVLSSAVVAMAWKAQDRLHRRYWALTAKAKPKAKTVTAVARELVGFVWAIGREVEANYETSKSKPRRQAA
jgi:transposase